MNAVEYNQLRETLREANFEKLLKEGSCADPFMQFEEKLSKECKTDLIQN